MLSRFGRTIQLNVLVVNTVHVILDSQSGSCVIVDRQPQTLKTVTCTENKLYETPIRRGFIINEHRPLISNNVFLFFDRPLLISVVSCQLQRQTLNSSILEIAV